MSDTKPKLTRREVSRTGLAALAAGAFVPGTSVAADNPDAALLALVREQGPLMTAQMAAVERTDELRFAARGRHPSPPASIVWRNISAGTDCVVDREMLLRAKEASEHLTSPEIAERYHQAQLAVLERWEADCDAVDAAFGVREAQASESRALDELRRNGDAIMAVPARTFTGILLKFALALHSATPAVLADGVDVPWCEMAASAMTDLLALHTETYPERHAAVIAALNDPATQTQVIEPEGEEAA